MKQKVYKFLRWLEKYTQTDMVYLAKGGFWLITGKIILFICSFGAMVAFARFLPKQDFGTYRYILSIIGVLAIFTLPGIDLALVKAIARGKEGTFFTCFKTKIKWGIIAGVISLAISIYYFFTGNLVLAIAFLIAAIFLPIMDAFFIFNSFWQGKKRFDLQNKFLISIQILTTISLILVIFFTRNIIFILLAYFIAHTFLRAFFFLMTTRKLKNQEKEKEALPFGKHLSVMTAAGMIGEQFDKILLWQFLGPIPVAIYSFAQLPVVRIRDMLPIASLALPKLSQKNLAETKKGLLKKTFKLFFLSIPLAIAYILLAPFLFKIFFPAYLSSIPYSQALALILVFIPFTLISSSLIAQARKKELYLINFISPCLKIILLFILLPFFGMWGAVLAILIGQFFNSILLLYLFKKL